MRSRNQERFDLLPVNRVWGSSTTPLKNLGIVPQLKFSLDKQLSIETIQEVLGDVAQLGEHDTCTVGVAGSNPVISTRDEPAYLMMKPDVS